MFYETKRKYDINEQAKLLRGEVKRKNFIRKRFQLENNWCEICRVDSTEAKLVLDHCHKTNLYRGLLCYNCNIALGLFKDRIDRLNEAIAYLKQFREDANPAE